MVLSSGIARVRRTVPNGRRQYCRECGENQVSSPIFDVEKRLRAACSSPTKGAFKGETRELAKKRKPLVTDALSPVYLVGAGPGDPELLTIKALRLLGEADVVVYDRLVSKGVLALIPSGATRIFAGKVARHHYMPQAEINELLVGLARSGRKVVRLKGGDPFVFGRGGEEAERLAESGVPFEIVPGVTSASGCSAYAGIPLTHRGLAHGVRYVAGHTQDGEIIELNWASLADPDTTLVVYMGRTNVRRLADQLIAHGLSAETPAAAILNGTRPDQRTLVTTLRLLANQLEALGLAVPTLLVIGRVVSLAEVLAWYVPDSADDDSETRNAP
jgi:uroporphyrin-III C-methyltransferase/precorrin-2 dehydrogenase/sirohydrochlorin ferrochelatase/uroporphyrin-III C-methyltransferase